MISIKVIPGINSSKKIFRFFLKYLLKGKLLKGPETREFEKKLSTYVGVQHSILTSSARYALYLILKSLKFDRGQDEILLPSFMPPIVAIVSVICGLKPVFVDINTKTFNIDPKDIKKKITKNSKILLIVHLYGIPCDMDEILKIVEKNNLFLIEDAAQSFGAEYKGRKVGSFGDVSIVSFGFRKNFNTNGGGLILTNNAKINELIKSKIKKMPYPSPLYLFKYLLKTKFLRFIQNKYFIRFILSPTLNLLLYLRIIDIDKMATCGYNGTKYFKKISEINEKKFIQKYGYKFSNFQSKIGLNLLKEYDKLLEKQNRNAEMIKISQNQYLPPHVLPAYFLCCIGLENRRDFSIYMFKSGILVGSAHYPVLPDMEIFEKYNCDCINARMVSKIITYIPFKTHLRENEIQRILQFIRGYRKRFRKKSRFPTYTSSITNLKP